jgi:hypothetical protein
MDNAEKQSLWGRAVLVLQHIPGGGLLFAVVLLAVLGYLGWYHYGAAHLDQALYALQIEKLTVSPQPEWIKASVLEEVFHNGRLDRISLLEPRANAAIARAFETHHWVRSATRVSKTVGGNVVVDLIYRRPAAMVYYQKQLNDSNSKEVLKGFFPIDETGTVLPTQDFTSEDVWKYFIIVAENARPAGDVGMPYGDVRISEALRLCALLHPYRESHRLQEIWVNQEGLTSGSSPWSLLIVTKDKREIVWGRAPALEDHGELPAQEKLKRMLTWLEKAPRNENGLPAKIDLRPPTTASPVSASKH